MTPTTITTATGVPREPRELQACPLPSSLLRGQGRWLSINHWLHGSGASGCHKWDSPACSHSHSATAPGSPCPWCCHACRYLVMPAPCPWEGDVLTPCVSVSHPKAAVPALCVEEGREGRVARGSGFIRLAKHTERRANSLGSLRLPGPSVCCPCQIIQPCKYKSSQAQREEDSCWASYTVLERIKAIQSSSLLH